MAAKESLMIKHDKLGRADLRVLCVSHGGLVS